MAEGHVQILPALLIVASIVVQTVSEKLLASADVEKIARLILSRE
jgi:hypothetical protein